MRLLIDIPNQDYVYIAKKHCLPSCDDKTLRKNFYEVIANGKPLDDVLDEIKGGIEEYEADCRLICPNDDCSRCDDVTFGNIYKVIDKYKEGSGDKE